AGGLARYTYWQLPAGGDPKDAAWTLETHAYGRGVFHTSRVALFAGASLGADTNYIHVGAGDLTKTTLGFGMNLESGVEIGATADFAIQIGADYHPGTDKIIDGAPGSISYFAVI